MPLPPGYYLDRSDPEILILRSPSGAPVARFNAPGYSVEALEREAWKDHRRQTGDFPPTSPN